MTIEGPNLTITAAMADAQARLARIREKLGRSETIALQWNEHDLPRSVEDLVKDRRERVIREWNAMHDLGIEVEEPLPAAGTAPGTAAGVPDGPVTPSIVGGRPGGPLPTHQQRAYELFLSHAGEDSALARDLYERLTDLGYHVFFDRVTLKLGDSLTDKIDTAIRECGHGVVLLQSVLLAPQAVDQEGELRSLLARQTRTGVKCLLPLWHQLSAEAVAAYSEDLADKIAVETSEGLDAVVEAIVEADEVKIPRQRKSKNDLHELHDLHDLHDTRNRRSSEAVALAKASGGDEIPLRRDKKCDKQLTHIVRVSTSIFFKNN